MFYLYVSMLGKKKLKLTKNKRNTFAATIIMSFCSDHKAAFRFCMGKINLQDQKRPVVSSSLLRSY